MRAAVTPIAALEYAAVMGCVGLGQWGRRIPARLRERAFDLGGFGNSLYSVLSYGPIQGPSGSREVCAEIISMFLGLGYL